MPQQAPSQGARPPACHLHQRGPIIDAIGRCIGECGAKDKALAYLLWGDLLQKASELRGGDDVLLWDATERYANSVATADTTAVVYTHWAKALALLEHHDEAQAKFAEAVHAYPTDYLAYFDWAEYLSGPYSERSWRNISAKDDDRLREAAKLYSGRLGWMAPRIGP